jgi:hypothetical protein
MLTANNKVKEYIPTAKKILMEDLFGKENTSTIIQDYIINIITTEEFLFLNPHVDGPCGFVGHVPVPGINAIARTWFTGSNNYRETSPIEIARQVYSYLQEYAHNREDAKSKERIDSAISSDIYSNVCHVTDALVQEGIVFEREDRPGYYYTEENENHAETLKDPDVLEVSRADYDRLRDRYLCLLDRLFSRLKLHHQDKYSFFKPKGFRLQYELAYI